MFIPTAPRSTIDCLGCFTPGEIVSNKIPLHRRMSAHTRRRGYLGSDANSGPVAVIIHDDDSSFQRLNYT